MRNIKLYNTTEEFNNDTEARERLPHLLLDKETGTLLGER